MKKKNIKKKKITNIISQGRRRESISPVHSCFLIEQFKQSENKHLLIIDIVISFFTY